MTRSFALLTLALLTAAPSALAQVARETESPKLFWRPAISRTTIVFEYGSDLWTVPRTGGAATRLTVGPGTETNPVFSADGSRIAFSGEYDGNIDVYVVPTTGGTPVRLTHHPLSDDPVAWTTDGKRVVFRSARASVSAAYPRLFSVSTAGGPAEEISLPSGFDASFSARGDRMAYMPIVPANAIWKKYRGGRTTPIWLVTMADGVVEKIPRENSNDFNPMWIGERVFFLSDRAAATSLFAYDTRSKQVTQVLPNDLLDVKSASASAEGDAIVYQQFGTINIYDVATAKSRPVEITTSADLPDARPRWVNVPVASIQDMHVSPTGARAVFSARGEIFTAPVEKGDVRNLTNSSSSSERSPAWSPDGRWIAYFSDESGEYALHLRDQRPTGTVKKISLGTPPSFYYDPVWSPDSKKIAFHDKRLTLWHIDVSTAAPKPVKVDESPFETPERSFDPSWSADSRWLAYTRPLNNHLHAVFAWSPSTGKATQITDGLSDARWPAFDRGGKYLYFTASTDAGQAAAWLDMSSFDRPVTRSVYLAVLRKDVPSPLAPESDDEADSAAAPKSAGDSAGKAAGPAAEVRIDFAGIGQRILSLPTPARNYVGLATGKEGIVFFAEMENLPVVSSGPTAPGMTIHRHDLAKRKTDKLLEGVNAFTPTANGEKVLVRQRENWFIAPAADPSKEQKSLRLTDVQTRVDPRAEWKQMYREAWRIQRDFLYDPGAHGLDLAGSEKRYEGWLAGLSSRADLTRLFQEMLGNLTLGHVYVSGGDLPQARRVPGGLLGADYRVENGRYRFARIYSGENWNPGLQAPLTQPGVNVNVGDYLIAVNGRDVRAGDDVHLFFEGTAGKQVVIRVASNAEGTGAREVTVVPVPTETALRNRAWVEDNRRYVERETKGRVAYVYVPNTSVAGYTYFNRYYFSQLDREAAVIDERFNGGGSLADYMVDQLTRPARSWIFTREGKPVSSPLASIYGPKVMIVNEYAGSGGDYLPWLFRKANAGKIVGTRTWGGLVGIYDYPTLVDGGSVTAPRVAITNFEGELDVENVGVAPDIEIEIDPRAWRAGRDPQLERAVREVMADLEKFQRVMPPKIKYPNHQTKKVTSKDQQ